MGRKSPAASKSRTRVIVPKFPTITNLKQWHVQLVRNVVLASGRTDHAEVQWMNAVMAVNSKFEDFADCGGARFATLDIKLHAALTQIIKDGCKTLAAKLSSLEDSTITKGGIVNGRQVAWLVHDWFRLNPEMKPLMGFKPSRT